MGTQLCSGRQYKKHVDVNFKTGAFFKFFVYSMINSLILGPFTGFLMGIFEGNFHLANNFGFMLRFSNWHRIKYIMKNSFNWFTFVIPVSILLYQCSALGWTLHDRHQEGLDIVLLIYCVIELTMQSLFKAARFGTFPSCKYRYANTRRLTGPEIKTEYLVRGWLKSSPNELLREINASIIRNSVDQRHFSFLPFADMSPEFHSIFTRPDHYDYLYKSQ
jgi:hypothetical protein